MHIDHVRVVDLTPDEEARCRELSFGANGVMCDELDRALQTERGWRYRYSHAILLREDEEIIGWAMVVPVYRSRQYESHVYVDPARRREGHGSKLLSEVAKYCKVPLVYRDPLNTGFFMQWTNRNELELEYV